MTRVDPGYDPGSGKDIGRELKKTNKIQIVTNSYLLLLVHTCDKCSMLM